MKKILGFPGYFIDSKGAVYSERGAKKTALGEPIRKKLKPYIDRSGYALYTLYNDAGKRFVSGHELVLDHFVGKRPKDKLPHHKDGDPANNKKSNLEWLTEVELATKLQGKKIIGSKGRRKRIKSVQRGLKK